MKYATIAAASLAPLATAASIHARQDSAQLSVTGFTASCTASTTMCWYSFGQITRDEFGVGCEVPGTSDDGSLPNVNNYKCGTYNVWITKDSDSGDLALVLIDKSNDAAGTYTISADDLTTKTVDGKNVESYTGSGDFTMKARDASDPVPSSAPTTSSTASSPTSSPTSGSDEDSSDNTSGDSDKDSDGDSGAAAVRGSALTAIVGAAAGIMAFVL